MYEDPPPEDARQRPEEDCEDTEAILARRRFLIASTLAGAGLGVALSGCQPKPCLKVKEPGPRVCLSVKPEPRVCLTVDPELPKRPKPDPPKEGASANPPRPEVCLSVRLETPPK
jgi:hypothetical protein